MFTLALASLVVLAGAILREPYDAVRYPLGQGVETQVAWISSRLGRALFQQCGLQLFVWPVARQLLGGGPRAVTLSAGIFALLHVPYPLLVGSTFVFGWVWVWLFRRGRRLAPLILSHAILAMVVFATLPDWVSHNLHVGRFEVERAPVYRLLASHEVRGALRDATSADYYRRQGGDDRAWVSSVFEDLQDRRPDAAEVERWTTALEASSRVEVAKKLIIENSFGHEDGHEGPPLP